MFRKSNSNDINVLWYNQLSCQNCNSTFFFKKKTYSYVSKNLIYKLTIVNLIMCNKFWIKLALTIDFATSILTLILPFLNNDYKIRRRLLVRVWIHSYRYNIIHCCNLIYIVWLYITIDCNNVDCLKCHRRLILFRYRQLIIRKFSILIR